MCVHTYLEGSWETRWDGCVSSNTGCCFVLSRVGLSGWFSLKEQPSVSRWPVNPDGVSEDTGRIKLQKQAATCGDMGCYGCLA